MGKKPSETAKMATRDEPETEMSDDRSNLIVEEKKLDLDDDLGTTLVDQDSNTSKVAENDKSRQLDDKCDASDTGGSVYSQSSCCSQRNLPLTDHGFYSNPENFKYFSDCADSWLNADTLPGEPLDSRTAQAFNLVFEYAARGN